MQRKAARKHKKFEEWFGERILKEQPSLRKHGFDIYDATVVCEYDIVPKTTKEALHSSRHLLTFRGKSGCHWYQFCFEVLAKKIWERYTIKDDANVIVACNKMFEGSKSLVNFMSQTSKHPVEVLWQFVNECEEFRLILR